MQAGQTLADIQRAMGAPHCRQRRGGEELWLISISAMLLLYKGPIVTLNLLMAAANALTRPQPPKIPEFILNIRHALHRVRDLRAQ